MSQELKKVVISDETEKIIRLHEEWNKFFNIVSDTIENTFPFGAEFFEKHFSENLLKVETDINQAILMSIEGALGHSYNDKIEI